MSGEGAPEALTFEQALAALDDVVRRMEAGEVGLEEAVSLFERGQAYLAVCRERLAAAQRRIDELTAASLPPDPGAPAAPQEPFEAPGAEPPPGGG
jgi:exodeoxyribonuclease VII small subunit